MACSYGNIRQLLIVGEMGWFVGDTNHGEIEWFVVTQTMTEGTNQNKNGPANAGPQILNLQY
jgi:hypothetical protein